MLKFNQYIIEDAGKSLADKAKKSGYSVAKLKKIYNRGVAAWKNWPSPWYNSATMGAMQE